MTRSAFLPDESTLNSLLGGLSASAFTGPVSASSGRAPRRRRSSVPPALKRGSQPPKQDFRNSLEARLDGARTLDSRFTGFVGCLKDLLDAHAIFVTDEEGLEMVHSDAGESYMAAAGEIGTVLRNLAPLLPDVEEGSTNLRLNERSRADFSNVELVWCKTPLGRYTVGVLMDGLLEPQWVQEIRHALTRVTTLEAKAG